MDDTVVTNVRVQGEDAFTVLARRIISPEDMEQLRAAAAFLQSEEPDAQTLDQE